VMTPSLSAVRAAWPWQRNVPVPGDIASMTSKIPHARGLSFKWSWEGA
jgi:hypothetical protein